MNRSRVAPECFRNLYVNFGSTLESMISSVIKDKSIVSCPAFAAALSAAANEWSRVADAFNAGNDTLYNLNRSGRTIDAILDVCSSPGGEWLWDRILSDVQNISRIVRFEFRHNVLVPERHVISSIGFEYTDMTAEDFAVREK